MENEITKMRHCPHCREKTKCKLRNSYESRKEWLCTECGKEFIEEESLLGSRMLTNVFCPYCKQETMCRGFGKDKKQRKKWRCTRCGRTFTEGAKFHHHFPIKCRNCRESMCPIGWKCLKCNKIYVITSDGQMLEFDSSEIEKLIAKK